MIKKVYLFTNRNLLAFDEKGEQVIDVQKDIGWKVTWFDRSQEREALKKIITNEPEIYLASWIEQWKHKITIDEFCSLLGHGPWYWENYKKKEITEEKEEKTND